MLLSSSVPFYGKSREDIARKILGNQWGFKPKSRWKKVSSQARQFIEDLLVMNPDERLDAESALGSTWLNPQVVTATTTASMSHVPQLNEETLVITPILRYATYPRLKKMVREDAIRSVLCSVFWTWHLARPRSSSCSPSHSIDKIHRHSWW
jgi:calcium-dependent protein kinase